MSLTDKMNSVDDCLTQAAIESRSGCIDNAANCYRRAVELDGEASARSIDAVKQFVIDNRTATLGGPARAALQELAEDLEGKPAAKDVSHVTGMLYYLLGDRPRAAMFFRKAVEFDPMDSLLTYHCIQILVEAERVEEAISLFGTTPESFKTSLKAHAAGDLIRDRGHLSEARAAYEQIEKVATGLHRAWAVLKIGVMDENLGDLEKAATAYTTAVTIEPCFGYALYRLGYVREIQGDVVEAISFYTKAVEADESLAEPYARLGYAYAERSEYQRAVEAYAAAHAILGDVSLLENIGCCFTSMNEYDHAIQIFNCVHEKSTGSSHGWECLGLCFFELRRFSEAISAFSKAIELNRANTNALDWLADTYYEAELYDEAIQAYAKYLQQAPARPDIFVSIGYAALRLGHIEEARGYYVKAVDLLPHDANVRAAYAKFLLECHDLDAFAKELAVIKELDNAVYESVREAEREHLLGK